MSSALSAVASAGGGQGALVSSISGDPASAEWTMLRSGGAAAAAAANNGCSVGAGVSASGTRGGGGAVVGGLDAVIKSFGPPFIALGRESIVGQDALLR